MIRETENTHSQSADLLYDISFHQIIRLGFKTQIANVKNKHTSIRNIRVISLISKCNNNAKIKPGIKL